MPTNPRGNIDRRISVAPMMDWTDEVYFIRQVSGLQVLKKACHLYVTSKLAGIHGDFAVDDVMCRMMCGGSHIMATNLSLDPDLIEMARKLSGERTKRAAVTKALEEFVARRRQKDLVKLFGKLNWDHSFDYKAERSRR